MNLPWETVGYSGWGGYEYFDTYDGTTGNPVIFVHGNNRDASDWEQHAADLLDKGWLGDDIWAISFGDTATHDQMASQLDHFVKNVREETYGVDVDVVAHSLGVTAVRWWMYQFDRYDWVGTFVSLAGPNHGTWMSWFHPRMYVEKESAMKRICRGSPMNQTDFLEELNEDETPGDVDYYTLRGNRDFLYFGCPRSPELDGAEENASLSVGHNGVKDSRTARKMMYSWLR